jgi:hypothetical protein
MGNSSPGPWRQEGYTIRDRHGTVIAALGPGADYGGTADAANAALVAAAPEMLELLRSPVKTWCATPLGKACVGWHGDTCWGHRAEALVERLK